MNKLIQLISEMGLGQTLYNVFFALGFVSVFLFVFFFGKKMGIKPWKLVATVFTVYPLAVLWMFILPWIESGFKNFGNNNIVRVFVYVPLIAYPVAKWLKLQWKEVCSLVALGPIAVHGVSHFGCMFVGCCKGYPCSWGLYNVDYGDIRFPSQPIEAIAAWIIIIYLLIRAKKKNYVPDGLEYPIMLALFGSTRFIFEFFRDNEKIWLGCSSLAFHALFMCVVGVVAIIVIKKRKPVEDTSNQE